MGRKYDLEAEKQSELAAIWGSEVDGDVRYPQRRRRGGGVGKAASATAARHHRHRNDDTHSDNDDDDDDAAASVTSQRSNSDDDDSIVRDNDDDSDTAATRRRRAGKSKTRSAKAARAYRLHCFVEAGTDAHAVRMALAAYEPKVEMRTAQKGNVLNRAHYAVLTFRNKAMALHAVQTLEGSDQRELLGVRALHFNLMLTRQQSRVLRRRLNQQRRRDAAARAAQTASEELQFIEQFVRQHVNVDATATRPRRVALSPTPQR